MKKIIFLFAIFICNFIFSQTLASSKIVLGRTTKKAFIVGDKNYKFSEYAQVFKNRQALEQIEKAKTNTTFGNVFASIGGGLMGFGLARAIIGGSTKTIYYPNGGSDSYKNENGSSWIITGVGIGTALVGVPFIKAAKKNLKKAIAIENGESSTAFQPYFQLESAGNGISLSYNF